jgi:(R,R)-butanediol dehydrogenase/meso-butanediol dehydrogenase/diacetyl reductase
VANPMGANNLIGNGGPEGAFADYLLVRNVNQGGCLYEIPEGVSMPEAALTEPLAVAMHAVNQGDPKASDKVAVFGAGPIGLGAIAALRYRGVENIVAVDMSANRRAIAEKMGARGSCHPDDALESLTEHQGQEHLYGMPCAGTDLFIDAAGVGPVVRQVVSLAKPGARLVVVGLHREEVPIDFRSVLMRELTIVGSIGYPREFPDVLEMLASGQVDTTAMRSHVIPFSQFDAAVKVAKNGEEAAKVLVEMSA